MAHEVETMAYAGETPWHGLGVPVHNDLTPEQMLVKAGLDWTVEKYPTYCEIDGEKIETSDQALVRSSDKKILSVVSGDWNPVQNQQAFEFFNDFVMEGDMEMHTAGSLKGGTNVWALAKVKDSFEILGGDKVEPYLLFSNPHQYGKCIDIRFTAIRVVCNNTLTLSLAGKSDLMVRLNHRRQFDAEMVKRTLGVAKKSLGTYKEVAEFLSSKNFTGDSLNAYLRGVFPALTKKDNDIMSRPAETALEVLETQPGAEFGKGTWWQAFNAVTYTTDHLLGHNVDTRLQSAWFGNNRQRKINALDMAVEFADAA
ncbi:LGT_TIGR03299, phage/plasmid-like protein TIGR03299 [uncultured Caudovirales phage]|uniref:LGT_TIGR03299, phage/plasmid-like protein TIGR03299 n=1 Tax=uncultured Caudovirales phage TaxID=2100421 RepID=A0A6J7X2M4_9CAUD|nr:LGT_TIGR03299, phage/plasmid-like protein TIGR03299 [uncultured Caudovirales phage]